MRSKSLPREVKAESGVFCECGAADYYNRERQRIKNDRAALKQREELLGRVYVNLDSMRTKLENEKNSIIRERDALDEDAAAIDDEKKGLLKEREKLMAFRKQIAELRQQLSGSQRELEARAEQTLKQEREIQDIRRQVAVDKKDLQLFKAKQAESLKALEDDRELLKQHWSNFKAEKEAYYRKIQEGQAELEHQKSELDNRRADLVRFQESLYLREAEIEKHQSEFTANEKLLEDRLRELKEMAAHKEKSLHEREAQLQRIYQERQASLSLDSARIREQEAHYSALISSLNEREAAVRIQEEKLSFSRTELHEQSRVLDDRERELRDQHHKIKSSETELHNRELIVAERERAVTINENSCSSERRRLQTERHEHEARVTEFRRVQSLFDAEKSRLQGMEDSLKAYEASLNSQNEQIQTRIHHRDRAYEEQLAQREKEIEAKTHAMERDVEHIISYHQNIGTANLELETREKALKSKEKILIKYEKQLYEWYEDLRNITNSNIKSKLYTGFNPHGEFSDASESIEPANSALASRLILDFDTLSDPDHSIDPVSKITDSDSNFIAKFAKRVSMGITDLAKTVTSNANVISSGNLSTMSHENTLDNTEISNSIHYHESRSISSEHDYLNDGRMTQGNITDHSRNRTNNIHIDMDLDIETDLDENPLLTARDPIESLPEGHGQASHSPKNDIDQAYQNHFSDNGLRSPILSRASFPKSHPLHNTHDTCPRISNDDILDSENESASPLSAVSSHQGNPVLVQQFAKTIENCKADLNNDSWGFQFAEPRDSCAGLLNNPHDPIEIEQSQAAVASGIYNNTRDSVFHATTTPLPVGYDSTHV